MLSVEQFACLQLIDCRLNAFDGSLNQVGQNFAAPGEISRICDTMASALASGTIN